MSEIEELKNRITLLEAALAQKAHDPYEVIVIRKPEPLPPKTLTGYWNVYGKKGGHCQTHVHFSKEVADRAAFPRTRLACLKVEWEEGQSEGTWIDVKDRD